MSAIPIDLSTNVAPAEPTAVGRAVEPGSAESATFGEHLQRVKSPANQSSVNPEKAADGKPSGQADSGTGISLKTEQCYAWLEPGDEQAASAILVLGELPTVLPETTDAGAIGEEKPADDESLALLLAECILVTNTAAPLVPITELTVVEDADFGFRPEESTPNQPPVLVRLPTAGQHPAEGVFRWTGRQPILVAGSGGSAAALPTNSGETNQAESQNAERAANVTTVVDPTAKVETAEKVASRFPVKPLPNSAEEPEEAAQPTESLAVQIEPTQGEKSVDANPPRSTHQYAAPDSEPSSPSAVPPNLEQAATVHGGVPAQPAASTSNNGNQGSRDSSKKSSLENDLAIQSPQPVAPRDHTMPSLVPTSERSIAPPLVLNSAKPEVSSSQAGGNIGELDRVRFVQRVARAVHSAAERGGEIRLRLSPPELGSLTLEVMVREGVMNARLETETTAARSILIDSLPALRERLAEQNVKIDRFDVNVRDGSSGLPDQTAGQADAEAHRESAARGRNRRGNLSPAIAKPQAVGPRVIGQGQINVIV